MWLSHETTIQRGCGFKWFCGAVTGWFGVDFCHLRITHPETNIATENRPLEKDIPIGNHHFQVQTVGFREGIFSTRNGKID